MILIIGWLKLVYSSAVFVFIYGNFGWFPSFFVSADGKRRKKVTKWNKSSTQVQMEEINAVIKMHVLVNKLKHNTHTSAKENHILGEMDTLELDLRPKASPPPPLPPWPEVSLSRCLKASLGIERPNNSMDAVWKLFFGLFISSSVVLLVFKIAENSKMNWRRKSDSLFYFWPLIAPNSGAREAFFDSNDILFFFIIQTFPLVQACDELRLIAQVAKRVNEFH